MALKLITAPTEEPVSLDEAKAQLRVDGADEDNFITSLIKVAREYCEGFQNRAYVTQTWDLWLDTWPDKEFIKIPLSPLQLVASVKYYDTENTEHTMDTADYFVDDKNEPGRVVLAYNKSWPSTTLRPANGVVIRFTVGYPAGGGEPPDLSANIPKKVKQAMLLLVGHWYENREAALMGKISHEIGLSVHALLWQDRVVPL